MFCPSVLKINKITTYWKKSIPLCLTKCYTTVDFFRWHSVWMIFSPKPALRLVHHLWHGWIHDPDQTLRGMQSSLDDLLQVTACWNKLLRLMLGLFFFKFVNCMEKSEWIYQNYRMEKTNIFFLYYAYSAAIDSWPSFRTWALCLKLQIGEGCIRSCNFSIF
jgi:hypothetical protein